MVFDFDSVIKSVIHQVWLFSNFNMAEYPGMNPGGAAVLDKQTERVRKTSPRYKVLLHNDPVNTMDYVVITLRQILPQLTEQDAISVMLETHNTGVGSVSYTHLRAHET